MSGLLNSDEKMKQEKPTSFDWDFLVRPGNHVVCSHMTAEPCALLRQLGLSASQRALEQPGFTLHLGVPFTDWSACFAPNTEFVTFGGMGMAGALIRSHTTHISMDHYRQCGNAFSSGKQVADTVLVSLARSGTGQLMLGAAHGYVLEAARQARTVVAEVNDQAPAIPGAPWPADIPINFTTEVSYPIAVAPTLQTGHTESAIAAHVATLIPDGACLQIGIGALADSVLAGLKHHRALGLHSGMLTPALWRLVESGVIDNSRKTHGAGISTIGCAYGDAAMYTATHDNHLFCLREPAHTHAADVIAHLNNFVAINSALEVDLLGQANSETVSTHDGRLRYVGGVGGLNDFIRGSQLAPHGKSIIALPSRQSNGKGRIVAKLSGPATVSASDADMVVTEHGAASLKYVGAAQRAHQMIAIAHPADRQQLTLEARTLGLLN
jgi:acyl-CoA hydrolase